MIWKWLFILMQIKLIYTKKGFLHLALFWKWKFWKLPIEMLPKAASSSGASFFAWQRRARNEWLVMNRKGPWEGYRRLAHCLLPAFLCAHIERDVWVRGSYRRLLGLMITTLTFPFCVRRSKKKMKSLMWYLSSRLRAKRGSGLPKEEQRIKLGKD